MKRLWATWRMPYITKIDKSTGCVFCEKIKEQNDEKNYILYHGKLCYVIMNLYPYNNGHLMVIPYRHLDDITKLTDDESLEMMKLLKYFVKIVREVMAPEGFNSGFNLGRPAGAGIADHIHLHIVPRWTGDTNFMPVISSTRVISESLNSTYLKIKNAIKNEEVYL